ncbi:hypothetical protein A8C56_00295 [Niabella ginsenosidivorans]|uniref:Uncharacterized protein n=1 Tax=Niabella ginsenosidivorans TaxID=1176587 RepID=A0A1A9HXS1_9BACT|nr:hypothetical protein A8C56_00295 [Niabella ginsenosidivorans]
MKNLTLSPIAVIILITTCLIFPGCKKEVTYVQSPVPAYKAEGIWIGSYTVEFTRSLEANITV